MPEGPEIKRAADQIAAAIAGKEVEEVFLAFPHLKFFETMLSGETVQAVEAHSKAIVIRFSNSLNIYSHNQLYGKWMIRKRDDYPKTGRQLRLALHNRDKSALLYSASEIEILTEEELAQHPYLSRLGPNLLDDRTDRQAVLERFLDAKFSRRQLSSLLLDQTFLAGPGNYLRSEIMFFAKVMPKMRPADCSRGQLERLATGSLKLTRRSYQTAGITNDEDRIRKLKAEGKTRRQYRFMVFSRAGQSCYDCGALIEKGTAGGRRYYYCTGCQAGALNR